jgi:Pentapeptide repeats (8 copies)
MTTTSNTWYLRRHGEVKGPYPAGLVSRYLLLGRVSDIDEVSSDGKEWIVIKEVPGLIPQIMKGDAGDPMVQERLQAARRWADERSVDRRGEKGHRASAPLNRRERDRREPEQSLVVEHRDRRTGREKELFEDYQGRWSMLMIAGTVAVVAGIFLLLYKPPPPQAGADCRSPAAPNVNWSNCSLEGAHLAGLNLSGATLYSASLTAANLRETKLKGGDLAYAALSIADMEGADLRGASLVGAKLRQTKLNNARLNNADLSYADLTGADLSGVSMRDTKLGNAIWTDGRRCLPDSVDICQTRQ